MYCTILSSQAKKERERDDKGNNDFDLWHLEKKKEKKGGGLRAFSSLLGYREGERRGGDERASFTIAMGFSSVLGYRKGGRGSEFYDNLVVVFSCTTLCIIQVQGLVGGGKKRRKKSPSFLLISMLYPYQMDRAGRGCSTGSTGGKVVSTYVPLPPRYVCAARHAPPLLRVCDPPFVAYAVHS